MLPAVVTPRHASVVQPYSLFAGIQFNEPGKKGIMRKAAGFGIPVW